MTTRTKLALFTAFISMIGLILLYLSFGWKVPLALFFLKWADNIDIDV
jgi:hypothetical protein